MFCTFEHSRSFCAMARSRYLHHQNTTHSCTRKNYTTRPYHTISCKTTRGEGVALYPRNDTRYKKSGLHRGVIGWEKSRAAYSQTLLVKLQCFVLYLFCTDRKKIDVINRGAFVFLHNNQGVTLPFPTGLTLSCTSPIFSRLRPSSIVISIAAAFGRKGT